VESRPDDDPDRITGDREKLEGRIRELYGIDQGPRPAQGR